MVTSNELSVRVVHFEVIVKDFANGHGKRLRSSHVIFG